jgi:hypothetical protein
VDTPSRQRVVWAVRGDLLVGLLCVVLVVVLMCGEASWVALAFSAAFVALWLVIPGLTQSLGVAALLLPALLVCGAVMVGGEELTKLWRGRGEESKVTPPAGPSS